MYKFAAIMFDRFWLRNRPLDSKTSFHRILNIFRQWERANLDSIAMRRTFYVEETARKYTLP